MSMRSEAVVRSLGLLFDQGTTAASPTPSCSNGSSPAPMTRPRHAFEGLVIRHGPMVFDVCDKVLDNPHDAQDAFQATFLVLATRARSIRRQRSVGSWLHGVALRRRPPGPVRRRAAEGPRTQDRRDDRP